MLNRILQTHTLTHCLAWRLVSAAGVCVICLQNHNRRTFEDCYRNNYKTTVPTVGRSAIRKLRVMTFGDYYHCAARIDVCTIIILLLYRSEPPATLGQGYSFSYIITLRFLEYAVD